MRLVPAADRMREGDQPGGCCSAAVTSGWPGRVGVLVSSGRANRSKPYRAKSFDLRMDTDYLLRKLQPLIPEKVRHWRRAKQQADPETTARLDRVIAEAAYHELGEFPDKLLLSLPPKEKAKGSFHIGTILYDRPK